MELALTKSGKSIDVSAQTFGRDFNEALVHQVVTAYLSSGRSGTSKQKTRSEVRGGGAKPWRQKGSGRARAGTTRGPIWRTGGVTFAAVPQDHSQKVNKKMYRGAMQSILSELIRQERLIIAETLAVKSPKTRELVSILKEFNLKNALIVTEDWDANLFLAARNLPGVEVCLATEVDPVSLLKFDNVLATLGAVRKFEEAFK